MVDLQPLIHTHKGLSISLRNFSSNPLERERRGGSFSFLRVLQEGRMRNRWRSEKERGETQPYPQPASHPTIAATQSRTRNSSASRKFPGECTFDRWRGRTLAQKILVWDN